MKVPFASFSRYALLALVAATALAGCGADDSPLQPAGAPDVGSQTRADAAVTAGKATLDTLWPNEDGRRWEYAYAGYVCDPIPPVTHATPEEVPPAPDPKDVLSLLGSRAGGPFPPPAGYVLGDGGCQSLRAPYALRFDGTITTESGVTAQNLKESLLVDAPAQARVVAADWQKRLLARLAQARPDLRAKLAAQGVEATVQPWFQLPLFLHGYAWEKTAEHIGTYGDVDQLLAWKFLAADISPGARFTHQLVPSLADDVFLYAYVVPKKDQWKLKGYPRDVQVAYVLDYGVSESTDPSGQTLGYARAVAYGTVVYAPGVGPVLCAERFGASSDDPAQTSAGNVVTLRGVTPGSALAAASAAE